MATIVLETQGLNKSYGSLAAVRDLSLCIYEGEIFGFLGPNGAGKTTSISMMCGLLRPDSGQVLLQGQPVLAGSDRLRARIGVCPQSIIVWERLTCLEQLQFIGEMYGMPAAAARCRSQLLLEEMDLAEKCHQQARYLSGGMQRRLNLIMALVHDPDVVILDEPEAGLDPQSRVKVREYIHSLAHRKTVILTTHNMDEADRLADRVAIIDQGKLLVMDAPEVLKRRVGVGDVLEIGLGNNGDLPAETREQVGRILEESLKACPHPAPVQVECAHSTLLVRALDAVSLLPQILAGLQNSGLQPGEVRVRQNTLEDVFIQLTGRRLRE